MVPWVLNRLFRKNTDFTGKKLMFALRRRALLSMSISLETRHLAWDSNNLFFILLLFCWLGQFFFSMKQSQKKWTPTSLIVLGNPAGLFL